ncbi:MAG TPA: sigma-70 family RNA polymerase sigma factor [Mycobacteriales bacterium]|nr:sigma-70 family RNA polymerase sigma factor [Mycobacteriales bacterium]
MDDVSRTPHALREARFRAAFAEVHDPVRRYVARRTEPAQVDDVVAEALLVLWRRLDDVPVGAELPWVYGIARRCLANSRRAQDRHLGLVARLAAQPGSPAGSDDDADEDVRDALRRLGSDDREVLALWAWEGLPPGEIAMALGISSNAASIRLHRAKRRLRSQLETGKDTAPAGHAAGGARRTPR